MTHASPPSIGHHEPALRCGRAIVLLGAGGHAAVVADVASSLGARVVGVASDVPPSRSISVRGPGEDLCELPWLGPVAGLDLDALAALDRAHPDQGEPTEDRDRGVLLHAAVGDAATRRRWHETHGPDRFVTIVAPSAIVSPHATLEAGVFVGPRAVVQTRARIGAGVIVNTGAIVEHDDVVGAFAHVAPGCVLCGDVTIGEGALVGANATVVPGRTIGARATVGAGAVVISDVPDDATVRGVPAR